jgi:hypothetical protein
MRRIGRPVPKPIKHFSIFQKSCRERAQILSCFRGIIFAFNTKEVGKKGGSQWIPSGREFTRINC